MSSQCENLSPACIMKINKEIMQLAKNKLDGIKYLPQDDESIAEIYAEIAGPGSVPKIFS